MKKFFKRLFLALFFKIFEKETADVEPEVDKTFCGDNICQADGNDFGIKETFFSCQIDCRGATEGIDEAVAGAFESFITNCFDTDPSTICLTPILNLLSMGENNIQSTGEATPIPRIVIIAVASVIGLVALNYITRAKRKKGEGVLRYFVKPKPKRGR